jgi:DNA-directed RNA polymerase specialized sigma24 family protein
MFYYDGLSYRDISATLKVAVPTVGSLISRARERLRSLSHRADASGIQTEVP